MDAKEQMRREFERIEAAGSFKAAFRFRDGREFFGWINDVRDDAVEIMPAPGIDGAIDALNKGISNLPPPAIWVSLDDIDPASIEQVEH